MALRGAAIGHAGMSSDAYFISCVSKEFKSYRNTLRQELTAAGRDIRVQEDFKSGGATLLEKLDDHIVRCRGIIHLIGEGAGVSPRPPEVGALLNRHAGMLHFLKELDPNFDPAACPFSYTQWEAYLAIYHGVGCFIYRAKPGSNREPAWTASAADLESQSAHIERLKKIGKDQSGKPFSDAREVAIEFLSGLLLDQGRAIATATERYRARSERRFLPVLPDNTVQRLEYLRRFVDPSRPIGPKKAPESGSQISIVCVHGMPGVGKTTLAIAAAQMLAPSVDDGQIYINLNGFSETDAPLAPEIALDSLLRQIGANPTAIPFSVTEKAALWYELLGDFRGVVVLDNARSIHQLNPLLPRSTKAHVIITSRSRLPELRKVTRIEVKELSLDDACMFFESFFDFTADTDVEIEARKQCVLACGCLPLMIRIIASTWASRTESYSQIFDWIKTKSSDDWIFRNVDSDGEITLNSSFNLLSSESQMVFAIASSLPGPDFTPQRLASVLGSPTAPLDALFELADHSLILMESARRYSIHDVLRTFGRRKLRDLNPTTRVDTVYRSALYYDELSTNIWNDLEEGASSIDRIRNNLFDEVSGIIATMEAGYEKNADLTVQLSRTLSPLLSRLGINTPAYLVAQNLVKASKSNSAGPALTAGHQLAANALMNMGEFELAEEHYASALRLVEAGTADFVSLQTELAFCFERLGRYEEGLFLLADAERSASNLGSAKALGDIRNARGAIYWRLSDYSSALESFEAALIVSDEPSARVINNIGFTNYKMGNLQEARKQLIASYKLEKRSGNLNAMTVSLVNLAYTHAAGRRPQLAVKYGRRALSLAIEMKNRFQQARALDALGDAFLSTGTLNQAASAWSEAITIFNTCKAPEAAQVADKLVREKLTCLN